MNDNNSEPKDFLEVFEEMKDEIERLADGVWECSKTLNNILDRLPEPE